MNVFLRHTVLPMYVLLLIFVGMQTLDKNKKSEFFAAAKRMQKAFDSKNQKKKTDKDALKKSSTSSLSEV